MEKFWVRAVGKRELPHQARTVAVYGTVEDARDYAYNYMQRPFGITVFQVFDRDMNELESFEA